MIELLLAAERLLAAGDLEHAERLFAQVAEADPRNAIAVVGLAEVAAARDDPEAVIAHARRALGIDPDNAAARRIVDRLEATTARPEATAARLEATAARPEATVGPESHPAPAHRSWLDRLIRLIRRR